MYVYLMSTGVVALGEIGDKTQLLALLLSTRFRKPVPIILGILVATIANHAFAGAIGTWITNLAGPDIMRWVLGISFLGMAAWTLVPDTMDDDDSNKFGRFGVFGTTVIAFFLAEMGDKTQVATIALAAQFSNFFAVVAGTTCGMLIADVPAVFLGKKVTRMVPIRTVHIIAAILFAVLGILTLLGVADRFL